MRASSLVLLLCSAALSAATADPLRDYAAQQKSVRTAAQTGQFPSRLSLDVRPAPFDAVAWAASPKAYLDIVEPGRVYQTATPGAAVPVLRAATASPLPCAKGATVTLAAMTAAWSSSGTLSKRPSQKWPVQPSSRLARRARRSLMHFMNQESERRRLALADGLDPRRVGGFLGDVGRAPRYRVAIRRRARMRTRPTRGDLGGRPGDHAGGIGEDDDVQVVGHHRVRQHIDGEGTWSSSRDVLAGFVISPLVPGVVQVPLLPDLRTPNMTEKCSSVLPR